jgi:methylthioribose-1-phosphate isomerase
LDGKKMLTSIKSLEKYLDLDRPTATKLRKLLDGRLDPENFKSVKNWREQAAHWPPKRHEMVMRAANELLGTHGVEVIRSENHPYDPYYGDIVLEYCNTGDSYASTLCYSIINKQYFISSHGDYVETMEASAESEF